MQVQMHENFTFLNVQFSPESMKMKMKGGKTVTAKREETAIEAAAREARNAYLGEWRAKNPDKVKQHLKNYWLKKAVQGKSRTARNGGT